MNLKIIYQDSDVLVVDKPAGVVVFPEGVVQGESLIDILIQQYPEIKGAGEAPRYGIVHRLDKDTSGVLLVAKTTEALIFLQKQFKNREVGKVYTCLVEGSIKENSGEIKTLIGRSLSDPRKQKAYMPGEAGSEGKREAITEYKVVERFSAKGGSASGGKDYTLLDVVIKTGRRHQIRCHFSFLQHPIAGDKLYAFKNSKVPAGLTRQFLHAHTLKIQLPSGKTETFVSELPEELKEVLSKLSEE